MKGLGAVLALLLLYTFTLVQSADAQTCAQADLSHAASVSMTWVDNSTDETGFILERKQDAGAYAVIAAALAANLTAYTDSTVVRGTVPVTYTYRIKAVRASDKTESAYSNIACITFAALPGPLPAPAGLTVSLGDNPTSELRISWEAVPEAASYAVEGKLRNGWNYAQIASTSATAYDWTELRRYRSYCVRVRADNPLGNYAGPVCVTTARW